jgi:hypothetical protein
MCEWIKLSDRYPRISDLPVLLWNKSVPKAKYTATEDALRSQLSLTCFSHWMPAPEPPKEPTQQELDEQWMHRIFQQCKYNPDDQSVYAIAVRSALHYRDEQVREIIGCNLCDTNGCGDVIMSNVRFQKLCRLFGLNPCK